MSELKFPSVTICAPGLDMEAVKEAILDDFNVWLRRNGRVEESYPDQLDIFMEERYAMKPTDGSIFDQIKAMNSPPPSSEKNKECKTCSSARLQNLAACAEKEGQDLVRRKRSTGGKSNPLIVGKSKILSQFKGPFQIAPYIMILRITRKERSFSRNRPQVLGTVQNSAETLCRHPSGPLTQPVECAPFTAPTYWT